MNLFQLLTHIPHEQMQRIAEEFGLSFTPSRRNLLQSIAQRYRDERFMQHVFDDVPYEARGLLRSLVWFAPANSEIFTVDENWFAPWIGERSRDELFEELGNVGLLFTHDFHEKGKIILPFEIRELLQNLFRAQYDVPATASLHDPIPLRTRYTGVEGVFALLCVLQHTQVKRTQKGNPHKRLLEAWQNRIHDESATEDAMNFALEYAVQRKLVHPHDETFELTDAVQHWLIRPEQELQRDLWHYVRNAYGIPRPLVQAFLSLLMTVVNSDRATSVVSIPSFRESLQSNRVEQESVAWTDGDFLFVLNLLQHAGILSMDSTNDPSVFRLTETGIHALSQEWPEASDPVNQECILQPNFDLLVPPRYGFDVLWQLDQLAEMKRRDVMTEFHITQERVLGAMRRGWDQERVLSFFDELTRHQIPDLVAFSLKEWCARYGRVHLKTYVVMNCDTPELAEEIAHIPDMASLIEQRVSPTHFLLEEAKATQVFRLLRERGYEPSQSISESGSRS